MSRCRACDKLLEETELLRKDDNGNFVDFCNECHYESTVAALWGDYATETDDSLADMLKQMSGLT